VERYWEHPNFIYEDPYAKKMAAMKPRVLEMLTPEVAWPENAGEAVKVSTELGDIDIALAPDGYRLNANNGRFISGTVLDGGRLVFGDTVTLCLKSDNVTQEIRFNVPLFARPTTEILKRPPAGDMVITSKYGSKVYIGVSDELLRKIIDDYFPTAWTLFHVRGGEPFMGLVKVGNHGYPHDQIDQHGMMGQIDHNFAEALRAIRGVTAKMPGGYRMYKLELHNKLPEYQTFDINGFFKSRGIGPIIGPSVDNE
jgi:hypothetical protein